ncbi:MAG: cyclic nucleotide-binding domain-containing protein [Methyloligellaceae bacterium]
MATDQSIDFSLLSKSGFACTTHAPGETIFAQGDAGDRMYVVRTGVVEIVHNDRVVDVLGSGEIFGEMALIDGSPRSAGARAREACELQPVDEDAFLFLVHETPHFALDVMRTLALRLRAMNERV